MAGKGITPETARTPGTAVSVAQGADWVSPCGTVELWNRDCREVLPMLTGVDVVVTDPPYGIGYKTSASRSNHARTNVWGTIVGDDAPFDPAHLLSLNLPTALWGANHYASRLPASPSWFIWDKRVQQGVGVNDSADCEMAWSNFGGPARMFRHMWNGMWRDSERGEAYHPTQKPVALMQWMLEWSPPGLVCDPYMGSGPTGVACLRANRKFIGCEVDPKHFATAVSRITAELQRMPLFPAPPPTQRSFLEER
jgi:site-specific DNA-methyltransferase (adenine-specific)